MFGAISDFVAGIFKPAADLIDNVHTSDEERLQLRNEFEKIQASTMKQMVELDKKAMDLQAKLTESAAKVAVAESQSDSWFTRTYRPAILTGMFILIALDSFGVLTNSVPPIFTTVFGAAFGVVGVGRTVEKYGRFKSK